jgi:hypothetical protein
MLPHLQQQAAQTIDAIPSGDASLGSNEGATPPKSDNQAEDEPHEVRIQAL